MVTNNTLVELDLLAFSVNHFDCPYKALVYLIFFQLSPVSPLEPWHPSSFFKFLTKNSLLLSPSILYLHPTATVFQAMALHSSFCFTAGVSSYSHSSLKFTHSTVKASSSSLVSLPRLNARGGFSTLLSNALLSICMAWY